MSKLSKDFLWGGAFAAHQFEGGWNKGGKGPSRCINCRSTWCT